MLCHIAAYDEQWDDGGEIWDAYVSSTGLDSLNNTMYDMWITYRCGHSSDADPLIVCHRNALIDLVGLEAAATTIWGVIEGRALGAVEEANFNQVIAECDAAHG